MNRDETLRQNEIFHAVHGQIERARSLADNYLVLHPKPPWSVHRRAGRAVKGMDFNQKVLPCSPDAETYWNRAVLPTLPPFEGIENPKDELLLSLALQGSYPHDLKCNHGVGTYKGRRLCSQLQNETKRQEGADIIHMMLTAAGRYWKDWKEVKDYSTLVSGIFISENPGNLDTEGFKKMVDYIYDRDVERIPEFPWVFFIPPSINYALFQLAQDKVGRSVLCEIDPEVYFPGINQGEKKWKLDYYIEQATSFRIGAGKASMNAAKKAIE